MDTADLLDSYLQDGHETLTAFAAATARLRAGGAGAVDELALLAHRMQGTAALYGHPQTARLAALAERLLEARPQLPPTGQTLLADVLSRSQVCLQSALDGLASGRGEGELGLAFAQVGGPEALRALLSAHPEAFKPTRTSVAARSEAGGPGGLAGELQRFYRDNQDVWEYFAPEVREHLEALGTGLDAGGPEAITAMFRAAHTIKGSSYMVGLPPLGELAHRLEDLMIAVREGGLALDARASAVLADGVALLGRMLAVAEGAGEALEGPIAAVQTRVGALLAGQPEPQLEAGPVVAEAAEAPQTASAPRAAARQSVRVGTDKLDNLMGLVGELVAARARLDAATERLDTLSQSLAASHERVQRSVRDFEERYLNPDLARTGAPESEAAPGGLRPSVTEQFSDLEFDSYDDLNILARAMTELSADLGELRGQFGAGLGGLRDENAALGKLLRRLRGEVSRTRRVPFGQALTRLRRWARSHPELALSVAGETLELDAHVAESLSEALLHLATNALAHGLEAPAERAAAGKPGALALRVQARALGNTLEVTVADDGRGIDLAAVRAQALARGQRSARELEAMSDAEATRLIFMPGLSTAAEVSAEAGRGVGMDVVAENLRRLGGEVLAVSQPGQGTRITLRAPLTQQVADLLIARVGPHPLALLGSSVRGLQAVDPALVERSGDAEALPDGTPLLRLQALWGTRATPGPLQVIVTETASGPLALAVDRFEGLQESVILPVSGLLGALGTLAGTSVSASGEVLPLLDPAGVWRLAGRPQKAQAQAAAPGRDRSLAERVLLVDDSISVRRAVSRMLERGGYRVETAHDGQAALDLLRADPHFALVVTDLEMPRVNGFELIEELRARYETAHLPVAVMTTRAGEKHQQLAFALGASDYFSKPVDEALLVRRLRQLVQVPV